MIYENATMTVPQEKLEDFKTAVEGVLPQFLNSPECSGARMLQCVEEPNRFLLVVEWASVEAHMAFRSTEFGAAWREALSGLRNDPVVANHFETVSIAERS